MDTDTDSDAYHCEDSSRCSDPTPATFLRNKRLFVSSANRPSAFPFPARKHRRRRGRRGRRGRGRDQPHVRVRPAAPHNSSTYIMDSHSQEETTRSTVPSRNLYALCSFVGGCDGDASNSDGDLFGDLDVDGSFFGGGGPYLTQLPPNSLPCPLASLSRPRFSPCVTDDNKDNDNEQHHGPHP